MIRISTARRLVALFWPTFEELGGAIVLPGTGAASPPGSFGSLTDFERFFGHTHILDEFRHAIPLVHHGEWDIEMPDPEHEEFGAAWELAKCVGQMWLAKLQRDFPERAFRVYVTKLADPILHFHQVRPGERPWISDEEAAAQIAVDELAVYTSNPVNAPAS